MLIDWLPPLTLVVLCLRLVGFLRTASSLDPVLDPLAFGAIAYFFTMVLLRIGRAYYMAPVDLIAVYYLSHVTYGWLKRQSTFRISVAAFVCFTVMTHDAMYSSFQVIERKSVMAAKTDFLGFLNHYLAAVQGQPVELFFPYTDGYNLMCFSAYLRNKGFHLDGPFPFTRRAGDPHGNLLIIAGPEREFPDGRCIAYRDYLCHHTATAPPDSLIVLMPEDDVSRTRFRAYCRRRYAAVRLEAT